MLETKKTSYMFFKDTEDHHNTYKPVPLDRSPDWG